MTSTNTRRKPSSFSFQDIEQSPLALRARSRSSRAGGRKKASTDARYPVLVDGETGAYGIVVPDLPGCHAMGRTVDQALVNAADAMRDWAEVTEELGRPISPPRTIEELQRDPDVAAALAEGAVLASVPLIRESGRPVKANLSLDSAVLAAIDAEAKRKKLTRSALVELMAKTTLPRLP